MPSLLERKKEHFVLWRPAVTSPAPLLVVAQFKHGNPPRYVNDRSFELRQNAEFPEIWEIPAAECGLVDGEIYHYWFAVRDANPYEPYAKEPAVVLCTDPLACSVDWRLTAPQLPPPYGEIDCDPPGVVRFIGGKLVPCDPGGEMPDWEGDTPLAALAPNNRLVIYELPTAWTRGSHVAGIELGVGTFRDILALVEPGAAPANFEGVAAAQRGRAHLQELGVNALELLPPADSYVDREWGYATSNYFAPDGDLGFPKNHLSPTPSQDLAALIRHCHHQGIRFFCDMVMAFATQSSYRNINYPDFFVQVNSNDPEEYTLDANGNRIRRDAFGGELFKYAYRVDGYDPVTGEKGNIVPARRFLIAYLERWMKDFRIDGIRLDSVVNYGNWDFMQEFKDAARILWRERAAAQALPDAATDERFLVVGEELSVPLALVHQRRLDGLWNEKFKRLVRCAILGETDPESGSFEWTVRRMIDCRNLGFTDLSQAVNYLTSHDVEGYRNERFYNFLLNNGATQVEKRLRLAFVCLLTAVGIPMIFAGEEFADQHDLLVVHPQKQVDPVNFDRREEEWRGRLFDYVARLVRLRTGHDALAVNDTEFIHVDCSEGKRVLAWKRGIPGSDRIIVVVANFSDYATPEAGAPHAEYRVNNWPSLPAGRCWREVTQDRTVPGEWAGREPVYPWEAKVYETA